MTVQISLNFVKQSIVYIKYGYIAIASTQKKYYHPSRKLSLQFGCLVTVITQELIAEKSAQEK
jgi:hypothetical protein